MLPSACLTPRAAALARAAMTGGGRGSHSVARPRERHGAKMVMTNFLRSEPPRANGTVGPLEGVDGSAKGASGRVLSPTRSGLRDRVRATRGKGRSPGRPRSRAGGEGRRPGPPPGTMSSSTAPADRIRLQDHAAITTVPTMPMTGSSQTSPSSVPRARPRTTVDTITGMRPTTMADTDTTTAFYLVQ